MCNTNLEIRIAGYYNKIVFGIKIIKNDTRRSICSDTHETSPIDINMPTRIALVLKTKDSFVSLVTNLNKKNNACKQLCLLYSRTWSKLNPLSSNIHFQILQTKLPTFHKDKLRDFDKRSKHFSEVIIS